MRETQLFLTVLTGLAVVVGVCGIFICLILGIVYGIINCAESTYWRSPKWIGGVILCIACIWALIYAVPLVAFLMPWE